MKGLRDWGYVDIRAPSRESRGLYELVIHLPTVRKSPRPDCLSSYQDQGLRTVRSARDAVSQPLLPVLLLSVGLSRIQSATRAE